MSDQFLNGITIQHGTQLVYIVPQYTDILDWIVQCFTSPPTQYRLYGRRFLQVKRPNQQYQITEGDATEEKSEQQNTHIHTQ